MNSMETDNHIITKKLFLESLNFWYPAGIKVKIANVSRVFQDRLSKKPSIFINYMIQDEMPRCLAFEIDEFTGDIENCIDNIGNVIKVMTEIDGHNRQVRFMYRLTQDEDKYYIHKKASIYPIFKYYFLLQNAIDSDYAHNFTVTDQHLKDLNGLEFTGVVKIMEPERFKKYKLLIPDELGDYNAAGLQH